MINNAWELLLVYPTLAVRFCVWIAIGYFASIAKEFDEAAPIDAAGYMQMLLPIFIPVAMRGIIAATISWGAVIYPTAFLHSGHQMVLTMGIIIDLIRGDVFEWRKINGRFHDGGRHSGGHLRLLDGSLRR